MLEFVFSDILSLFNRENGTALFFSASVVVAVITRKDMALWCCFGFLLSHAVYISDWVHESKVLGYGLITVWISVISAAHYQKGRYPLSIAICLVCIGMLFNLLFRMVDVTDTGYWISVALGIAMLVCLLCIPGRKGWINDLASDFRLHGNSRIHTDSNSDNGRSLP